MRNYDFFWTGYCKATENLDKADKCLLSYAGQLWSLKSEKDCAESAFKVANTKIVSLEGSVRGRRRTSLQFARGIFIS